MHRGVLLFLAGLAVPLGCDGGGKPAADEPYTAPRPAHPAMTAPASVEAPEGAGRRSPPAGALPPGHPPVSESAPAAPAATAPPTAGAPAAAASGTLARQLAGIGLAVTVPGGWLEETPTSPMRLATIRLPRVEGDARDGEMSVSRAGGSVDDNIRRWRNDQFVEKPEPVIRTREAAGGIKATVVELEGTFTGGGAPMAGRGGAPVPGTKLWGAIVELPGSPQLVFFKAWGPARTMERWQPSLEEFLSSLKPSR